MFSNICRSILLSFVFLVLTACGGGGGGGSNTPSVSDGRFIDAAVEGIEFSSGTESGVTDNLGTFSYQIGQPVTFSIGDIVIGTVSGKNIITPVDLVVGAFDETNPTVTNIVQFLLTIDEDQNALNGLQISEQMRTAAAGLTVDFTSATFDSDMTVQTAIDALAAVTANMTRTLVNELTAQAHLGDSLLTLMAGNYSGTFSGGDFGTWSVSIGTDGSITGNGNSNWGDLFEISGTVSSSGDLSATGLAGLATWTGDINASAGTISGEWSAPSLPASGTFSGSRQ